MDVIDDQIYNKAEKFINCVASLQKSPHVVIYQSRETRS